MKRVLIAADGLTVGNVIAFGGTTPAPAGTYLDVADALAVGPRYAWNGNVGAPTFAPPAAGAPDPTDLMVRIAAVETAMPLPAAAAPPDVSVATPTKGVSAKFALEDHSHPARVQRGSWTTDAAGQVSVAWPVAFGAPPIPNAPVVLDAGGGRYAYTVISNTAATTLFQITRQRVLPSPLTLLSALVGYDTFTAAPAGLTVFCSAGPAT